MSKIRFVRNTVLALAVACLALFIKTSSAASWVVDTITSIGDARERSNTDQYWIAGIGSPVLDFALLDLNGKEYRIGNQAADAVVLFFTGVGCPVARASLPKLRELESAYALHGVRFFIVDSVFEEPREDLRAEMKDFGSGKIPVLVDETQAVARLVHADRTATTVLIKLPSRKVVYRGAIDDQLSEGAQKGAPSKRFLKDALDALLAGKTPTTTETVVRGCITNFQSVNRGGAVVSFEHQVIPILKHKWIPCHSMESGRNATQISVSLGRNAAQDILQFPSNICSNSALSMSLMERRTVLQWALESQE